MSREGRRVVGDSNPTGLPRLSPRGAEALPDAVAPPNGDPCNGTAGTAVFTLFTKADPDENVFVWDVFHGVLVISNNGEVVKEIANYLKVTADNL